MSSADPTKALADFWKQQSEAFLKVQEQTGRAMADGMQALMSGKVPEMPNQSGEFATGAADLARAGQSVGALWSAASALSGALAKALPAETPAGGDVTIETILHKIVDPRSWMAGAGELDDVLGRMAEGPRFADLWDIERRYARVLQAWMNVRRRGLEHQAVVLEAWVRAGRQFSDQLAAQKGADADGGLDSKALLALWTETANRQLVETQRSDDFLQTQTAMIRASTELRLAQQELTEHFGKQYGFPTRTELDDVHRTVTELRRELRAIRREHRLSLSSPPSAPVVEHAAAKPSTRRSTAKQPLAKKRGKR